MEKLSEFRLKEEKSFLSVRDEIVRRGNERFEFVRIKKATSVWKGVRLCGFLLTIEELGVKSFHGYNFTKGNQWVALCLARQYIKEEGLDISMSVTNATTSILKRLGFKESFKIVGVRVMRLVKDKRGFAGVPLLVNAIIAAIAGGGIAEGISAIAGAGKNSQPAPAPLPTETAAASTATAAQTQARQSALIAGGQTNVTEGSGIILGGDVSSVTLVGSN
jgi:hypothetical protein